METLNDILAKHPNFKALKPEFIAFLADCAREETFTGDTFIFKTGEPADKFYLLKSGKVGIEVYSPPQGPLNILTLSAKDILGWSWLYPPYTWHFEARAIKDTEAYALDAQKVREECQSNFEFGYRFTHCFGQIMMQRLAATRLQLLDVYGTETRFQNYTN